MIVLCFLKQNSHSSMKLEQIQLLMYHLETLLLLV